METLFFTLNQRTGRTGSRDHFTSNKYAALCLEEGGDFQSNQREKYDNHSCQQTTAKQIIVRKLRLTSFESLNGNTRLNNVLLLLFGLLYLH